MKPEATAPALSESTVSHLAEEYGENLVVRLMALISSFFGLVLHVSQTDVDEENGGRRQRSQPRKRNIAQLVEMLGEWDAEEEHYSELAACESAEAIREFMRNFVNDRYDWGCFYFETDAELLDRRMNENRDLYEPLACQIARKHGVQAGTIAFMDALLTELNDQRQSNEDRRYGMREDGLCASGGSVEGWFDEFNAVPRDLSNAQGVMDWIREYQPLLYGAWKQQRDQKVPA